MSGPLHPTGRGRVSARSPRALAVCQRCGFTYQRTQLCNQVQWQGMQLQPLNLWVCKPCYDTPQQQLRAIILPPDPVPIDLPFPEPYLAEVPSYLVTETGACLVTGSGGANDFMLVTDIQVTPTPDPNQPYLVPPDF